MGYVFSEIGAAALIAREALKTVAYLDSVGVWTIGVGHTAAAGGLIPVRGMKITREAAIELFKNDLKTYEAAVQKAVKRPMTQNQYDAFVSICYNIGITGFAKSTFVRRFNAGDIAGCAEAIMQWTKPPEVTSRRRGEQAQFLTPYEVAKPRARIGGKVKEAPVAPESPVAAPPAPEPVAPVSRSPKGVLSGLWALLQGKPPVPVADRKDVQAVVREETPSIAKDISAIRLAGIVGGGASLLGGADAGGLLDTVKQSADSVRDTSASVKDLADIVIGAIRWGVSHWWVFGIGISVFVLFRIGWAAFKLYMEIVQFRANRELLDRSK